MEENDKKERKKTTRMLRIDECSAHEILIRKKRCQRDRKTRKQWKWKREK
jgi:hypothetical protein